jgi:hypothetical protein
MSVILKKDALRKRQLWLGKIEVFMKRSYPKPGKIGTKNLSGTVKTQRMDLQPQKKTEVT